MKHSRPVNKLSDDCATYDMVNDNPFDARTVYPIIQCRHAERTWRGGKPASKLRSGRYDLPYQHVGTLGAAPKTALPPNLAVLGHSVVLQRTLEGVKQRGRAAATTAFGAATNHNFESPLRQFQVDHNTGALPARLQRVRRCAEIQSTLQHPATCVRYNHNVDPAVLSILRCPRCRATAPFADGRSPRCGACGLEPQKAVPGVLDLIDVAVAGEPTAPTAEQRLMESDLIARIYDRVWRPAFVRVFGGHGAGDAVGGLSGELYIHKHSLSLDERPGPWLDLSCGPGAFVRALAAAVPGALVVGLDISRAMLEAAAQRTRSYPNVVLVRGDAHSLPFTDEAFGGVNNAGALHAYDDPELVFREVRRVLVPGGIYVGSTFATARTAVGRLASRATGIRRFDPSALRTQLQRVGFSDFEDVRLGEAFVFRVKRA